MPHQPFHSRNRDRLGDDWRGTRFALALVAVLLAMGAAGGCASDGPDQPHKPRLPVPAEFREQLARLVYEKKWAEASAFLRSSDAALQARAASEKSDIRYFIVMGIGPMLPGLEPHQKPARTWTVPGTSDNFTSVDQQHYNVIAYDFAKQYNTALAKEERGVR